MIYIPPAPPTPTTWGQLARRLLRWLFLATVLTCTAALVVGVLTPWFAAHYWWCEIACHFQVQYTVGLVGLAGLCLLLAGRRLAGGVAVLALLAFVIHWLPIYWATVPASSTPAALKILSANLFFANLSPARFRALVDREQPDVVLIFELSHQLLPHLKLLEMDYPYSRVSPSPGHSGCGIYSKLPLENPAIEKVGPYPNFVVVAGVRVDGVVVNIFGTHPLAPYTPEEMELRNGQLKALSMRMGPAPTYTVVIGDFNTTGWSPCFSELMAATGMRDTRRGFGICATFPAAHWPARIPIDHCLVSNDLGVVDRRVGPDVGSDHLPIIVELSIEADDSNQ